MLFFHATNFRKHNTSSQTYWHTQHTHSTHFHATHFKLASKKLCHHHYTKINFWMREIEIFTSIFIYIYHTYAYRYTYMYMKFISEHKKQQQQHQKQQQFYQTLNLYCVIFSLCWEKKTRISFVVQIRQKSL